MLEGWMVHGGGLGCIAGQVSPPVGRQVVEGPGGPDGGPGGPGGGPGLPLGGQVSD